ncbi:MAG: acetate/propionate family kinase [Tangfeifania sp.]
MNILIINCGSSSIKFQLFRMPEESLIAQGKAEKSSKEETRFSFVSDGRQKEKSWEGFSYQKGLDEIFRELVHPDNSCLDSLDDIDAVGHRLIHGGEEETGCVEITEPLLEKMEASVSLAPLHYPPNIEGIKAITQSVPEVLQAGVFDTAFHTTLPEKAFLYGLPLEWYEKHRVRKYGFHGTSHKYASQKACEMAGLDYSKSKVISCHLGNGASLAAVKNGKSVDTSMGFTPVEGLLMGTRSGDIDAGLILNLQENFNLSCADIQQLINKEGGLLGLSGVSSDYRAVEKAAANGNEKAQTALDVYHYRIKKYIGAYAAALGGPDVVVFTGGVGENSSGARKAVCDEMEFLGLKLSAGANEKADGKEMLIHENDSKIKIAIVPANEELVIAREVTELAKWKLNNQSG